MYFTLLFQSLFEDVFAEPKGTYSIDYTWDLTHQCYTFCKTCHYRFMTFFCGCFIAMFWGTEFAVLILRHVYCVTPCARLTSVVCGTWQRCWGICMFCLVAPVCDACAWYWSQIHVTSFKN